MRSPLRLVLASVVAIACSRPQPNDVPAPDPSTKPLPSTTAPPAPAPSDPTDVEIGGHVCEPIVECGFWSKCLWLEKIDATRYRAVMGDVGRVFVRRHECVGVDGGSVCAVHCRGADGGPPCVDAFHPEMEACNESAPPSPNSTVCHIGDGICGSLM